MATPRKQGRHYVNNKEFYADFVEYKKMKEEAEAAGLEKPRLTNAIGAKIMLIANHVSYKPNFIGYSFRDEMVDDAIENCIRYADNFDVDKSTNPFAYFTQICTFAFIRRIQKERRQFMTKVRYVQQSGVDINQNYTQDHDADETYSNSYLNFLQNFYDVDSDTGKKKEESSEVFVKKSSSDEDSVDLTDFFGGEDDGKEDKDTGEE